QPPGFATGLYPSERDGDTSFAWTADRPVLRLDGLDRRVAWTCTLRIRGARDASMPPPSIGMATATRAAETASLDNTYREIATRVPADPDASGLVMTAEIGPTFVPGGADRRALGAQVDWIRCAADGRAAPPTNALGASALFAGAIGLA